MTTRWILAACLLAAPAVGRTAAVGPEDVTAAVETWVRGVTANGRPDAVVADIEPYRAGKRIVAYIVRLEGGGFCIAGADDRLVPVAVYAPRGSYDPACPAHQWTLNDLAARFDRFVQAEAAHDPVLDQYREKIGQRQRDWRDLIARRQPASLAVVAGVRETPTQMALPVTSLWHQLRPYNNDCPILSPGSDVHCVVGCVATASLQIMYYWQWPPTGVGSGSTNYNYYYTTSWISQPLANDPGPIPVELQGRLMWTAQSSGTLWMNAYWDASVRYFAEHIENANAAYLSALSALYARQTPGTQTPSCNFATTYDWSIMHDAANDPPDAGDAEAAKVSYHMAVAALTEFGIFGSGSDHPRAIGALTEHFRYDTDAYSITTASLSGMITEIQWLRPAQMSGPGHSWMVCGYNTGVAPYQFLMNYGWPGTPLTWDTVDDIFPGDHNIVLRVAPASVVRFVGNSVTGDGTPSSPYRDLAQAALAAPSGSTLIFKTETVNPFASTSVVIDRPMTLKGVNVTIQPQ